MAKKTNIFLVGMMGAGKTTIGKLLAKQLGLTFHDSDHEIEKRSGATVAWIFDLEGEAGFRQREAKMIEELSQLAGIVLATGGGVILNPHNRKILSEHGIVVYLRADMDELFRRTSQNQNRPLLAHKNPRQILENLFEQRDPLYQEIADLICETDAFSVSDIVASIKRELIKKGYL